MPPAYSHVKVMREDSLSQRVNGFNDVTYS